MIDTELSLIMRKIEPWLVKGSIYTTLALKPNAPQDIVDLFEEWNRMVDESDYNDDGIDW
nr:MAG TPA: Ras-related protein Rab-8A, Rab-3A-interacting protein GTPase, Guanine Nucleotide Exchange [Caudoviricetes sp.]